jgi:hypothetical protein
MNNHIISNLDNSTTHSIAQMPATPPVAEGSGPTVVAPASTQRKRYLAGFMTQAEAAAVLTVELGENFSLARLKDLWLSRVTAANVVRAKPFILDDFAHSVAYRPIPPEHAHTCDVALQAIAARGILRGSVFTFAMVRIDDLIVLQSSVTLERAAALVAALPAHPTFDDLLRITTGISRPTSEITHRRIANTTTVFTTDDHDVRPRPPEVRVTGEGAHELVLSIGPGDPTIYAVRTFMPHPDGGLRWFLTLQNGVHRLFALRERGIEYVPLLVVDPATGEETEMLLSNWSSERRKQSLSSRPPLLRDFFHESLTMTLDVPRTKMCFRVEVKVEKFPV